MPEDSASQTAETGIAQDGEFPKNLKYLWNHPDLSRTTKEKIAYHNGKEYFRLGRAGSAPAARKAN